MNYDLFLPADSQTGDKFRAKFDVDNPDRDSRSLYTSSESGGDNFFRFPRIRAYETAQEKEMDHDNKYDEEVILAFRDDDGAVAAAKATTAYYYPVMQRTTIRNQRTKNIARTIGITDEEETHLDELHVRVDEPSDELKGELARYKKQPVGDLPEEEEEGEGGYAGAEDGRGSASPAANGGRGQEGRGSDEEEQDADGEEE